MYVHRRQTGGMSPITLRVAVLRSPATPVSIRKPGMGSEGRVLTIWPSATSRICSRISSAIFGLNGIRWRSWSKGAASRKAVSPGGRRGNRILGHTVSSLPNRMPHAVLVPGRNRRSPANWAAQADCPLTSVICSDLAANSQISRHLVPRRSALILESRTCPSTYVGGGSNLTCEILALTSLAPSKPK